MAPSVLVVTGAQSPSPAWSLWPDSEHVVGEPGKREKGLLCLDTLGGSEDRACLPAFLPPLLLASPFLPFPSSIYQDDQVPAAVSAGDDAMLF